jgi:hypothetical protein
MKTATDLLPLAIGVAIVCGVTWLLLDQDWALGRWLLAALLFVHGWVHLMFVFPQPAPAAGGPSWPFDMSGSWLVGGVGLDVSLVRALGVAVMVIAFVGFVLSALSTVNLVVPTAWWTALVIGASVASIVLLGLFFSPTLLLGIAIDLVLLWFVITSVWSPAATGVGGGGLG